MTDFHDFIGTTEKSQEKIEESVMTLLHVVNKESDILFRKKKQVAAETSQWTQVAQETRKVSVSCELWMNLRKKKR